MKINEKNLNNYKMNKERKINILNIKEEYKNIEKDMKEKNINEFINNILFYLENDKDKEIIKKYFENYKYFKKSIIHILINNENKEIIILRNNNEKKFFENSHIKYFLENRKENELIIDFENRLNQILINKNFIIYDYLKFDIIEK